MTLAEFSQSILIYYAANMVVALIVMNPRSKSFEQLMQHPAAQTRPALLLLIATHFLIPALIISILHPKRLKMIALRLTLPLRIWRARLRLTAQIKTYPPALQAEVRKQLAGVAPKDLPNIRLKTMREIIDEQSSAKTSETRNDP